MIGQRCRPTRQAACPRIIPAFSLDRGSRIGVQSAGTRHDGLHDVGMPPRHDVVVIAFLADLRRAERPSAVNAEVRDELAGNRERDRLDVGMRAGHQSCRMSMTSTNTSTAARIAMTIARSMVMVSPPCVRRAGHLAGWVSVVALRIARRRGPVHRGSALPRLSATHRRADHSPGSAHGTPEGYWTYAANGPLRGWGGGLGQVLQSMAQRARPPDHRRPLAVAFQPVAQRRYVVVYRSQVARVVGAAACERYHVVDRVRARLPADVADVGLREDATVPRLPRSPDDSSRHDVLPCGLPAASTARLASLRLRVRDLRGAFLRHAALAQSVILRPIADLTTGHECSPVHVPMPGGVCGGRDWDLPG